MKTKPPLPKELRSALSEADTAVANLRHRAHRLVGILETHPDSLALLAQADQLLAAAGTLTETKMLIRMEAAAYYDLGE